MSERNRGRVLMTSPDWFSYTSIPLLLLCSLHLSPSLVLPSLLVIVIVIIVVLLPSATLVLGSPVTLGWREMPVVRLERDRGHDPHVRRARRCEDDGGEVGAHPASAPEPEHEKNGDSEDGEGPEDCAGDEADADAVSGAGGRKRDVRVGGSRWRTARRRQGHGVMRREVV
ncbi:hypothetical protein CC85DRAFT_138149 [Cutaneotrichosporon oleaginosum]|uniref:Uncharacterized protein n=1 Tax=Cutaneotrichosporon oleaginosum TaxID=879819 RepID=A0A0J0XIK9_9TREE|nr:uncharacterized protein CC85DRAFT_138149 [Cutaneotrichosporon oleaginosum]KLT40920.1 hypothetical protein CC85DRAFT_138149 [Cutaneotrichosporon oleaginosum]TXT15413.1 hypothetical protein COLE_01606 [Cutaneotrichosporon oleaginosum]